MRIMMFVCVSSRTKIIIITEFGTLYYYYTNYDSTMNVGTGSTQEEERTTAQPSSCFTAGPLWPPRLFIIIFIVLLVGSTRERTTGTGLGSVAVVVHRFVRLSIDGGGGEIKRVTNQQLLVADTVWPHGKVLSVKTKRNKFFINHCC